MTELLLMALAGFGGTEIVKSFFSTVPWVKILSAAVLVVVSGLVLLWPLELADVVWMIAAFGGALLFHRLYRILKLAGDHHLYLMVRNR